MSNVEEISRKRGTIDAAKQIAANFVNTDKRLDDMKDKIYCQQRMRAKQVKRPISMPYKISAQQEMS